jgi:hypothetical protein
MTPIPFKSQRNLPEHNNVLFTQEMLLTVLRDLSTRILQLFSGPIRLVVHGGAVMLLHPAHKGSRHGTRDVDYIQRSFISEQRDWFKVYDAGSRLQMCINATASQFGLGKDWMNAHADVALPMAYDSYGRPYDPIYQSAITDHNRAYHTIFKSPGLILVSVTPAWGVALKMVRYAKDDPADIRQTLLLGSKIRNGGIWTEELLEKWLTQNCQGITPENFGGREMLRQKIRHAVAIVGVMCRTQIPYKPEFALYGQNAIRTR